MLHIRNLDDATYEALVRKAHQDQRTLSAEAAVILAQSLLTGPDGMAHRRQAVEAAKETGKLWPKGLPAPEDLIAEDRRR